MFEHLSTKGCIAVRYKPGKNIAFIFLQNFWIHKVLQYNVKIM